MDSVALWLGWAVLTIGGVSLAVGMLYLLTDFVGAVLWRKLCALYDLNQMRALMSKMQKEGRTWSKP